MTEPTPLRPAVADSPPTSLPHNIEAEQALLGAILVNNRAYERVSDFLRPEHFAEPVHGRIYEACASLIDKGHSATGVTLKNVFDQDGALASIGGAAYLARLATSVVTIINAEDYGRTIHDAWLRRSLMELAATITERAPKYTMEEGQDARALLEETEQGLFELAERSSGGETGPRAATAIAAAHAAQVEEAHRHQGRLVGLATGLHDLDWLLGGLRRKRLAYLAGRPSMGKSLVAGVIAYNVARDGNVVLINSLEQEAELWFARWVARLTGLPTDRQERGDLDANDWSRFLDAKSELANLPIEIDDTPGQSIAYMRQRARRMKRRRGRLDLMIVDHVGHVAASRAASEKGDTARLTEISRGLLHLAKELDVPILAVSQLNRAVESRDDKRPTLADLRDSGSLEQDAHSVTFVYRHAYYLERSIPQRKANETEQAFNERQANHDDALNSCSKDLDLIVAKNRAGKIGARTFHYDGAAARVTDRARGAI